MQTMSLIVNHVPLYVCFNAVHATMILLLECYDIETARLVLYLQTILFEQLVVSVEITF